MELLPYKSIDPSFALHWCAKIIFEKKASLSLRFFENRSDSLSSKRYK